MTSSFLKMSSATQKQIQKVLHSLMRISSNKKCADCGEQCAVNVDATHSTFLCTRCGGIHREFGDRIKSVSMASFTQEEIANLQATSNEKFNQIWMAKWDSSESPLPMNADDARRRAFLVSKYQNKKWYSKKAMTAATTKPIAKPKPASTNISSNIVNTDPAPQITPAPTNQLNILDIFNTPSAPAPPKQWSTFDPAPAIPKQATTQSPPVGEFDPLDLIIGFGETKPALTDINRQNHDDLKSMVLSTSSNSTARYPSNPTSGYPAGSNPNMAFRNPTGMASFNSPPGNIASQGIAPRNTLPVPVSRGVRPTYNDPWSLI